MGKFVNWLTSLWSVILIISILLFVFWGGPVFSPSAGGHTWRLIVSYSFIPLAVAAVLVWRKRWEWATFAYYTFGIALIKMVVTMGVFVGASPRRAGGVAKSIDRVVGSAAQETGYRTVVLDRWGDLRGYVKSEGSLERIIAVISNIQGGKQFRRAVHEVSITSGVASPRFIAGAIGDSLVITNHDGVLHTFSVSGDGGALFQVPLAPGKSSPPQAFSRAGVFSSHCAQGHPDEVTRIFVSASPYHTSVAPDGAFAIDSIPAGRYQLSIFDLTRDGEETDALAAVTSIAIVAGDTTTVEILLTEQEDVDSDR
jgi:hypothetical protein